MATAYQPSPSELGQLVALLIQRYSVHRGKEVSRVRLARKTLRRMAGRPQLRDGLVDKWMTMMNTEQGWLVFPEAEEFLLLKSDAAKTWTKLANKRIDDLLKRLAEGDKTTIADVQAELKPHTPAESEAAEETEGAEETTESSDE